MTTLVRHRQHTTTGLFPHQANRRYILPNRERVAEPPPGINLLQDPDFITGCGEGIWGCASDVTIDTALGFATLGPSVAGAEILGQGALWQSFVATYRAGFLVRAVTTGPVPINFRIGNTTGQVIVNPADVGNTVTVDIFNPGTGPQEFQIRLDDVGHTIEIEDPRVERL